jgi:hypothetical protein
LAMGGDEPFEQELALLLEPVFVAQQPAAIWRWMNRNTGVTFES